MDLIFLIAVVVLLAGWPYAFYREIERQRNRRVMQFRFVDGKLKLRVWRDRGVVSEMLAKIYFLK